HDAPALQQRSLVIASQAETAEISASITSSEERNVNTDSPKMRLRGSMTFRRIDKQDESPSLGDDGSKVEMDNDKSSKRSSTKSPNLRGSA
ncbi:unnamed protein product, partial [Amoebophrya sp. A25]